MIEIYVDGIPTPFSQSTPADIVALGAPDGTVVVNDPFAEYRLRDRTIPFCPTEIDIVWTDLLGGEIARLDDVAVAVAP